MTLERQPYLPQLDAIRAIAVLFVMVFHFIPGVDRYAPLRSIGVRLFFVLSGFLITGILTASRDRPTGLALRTFYARRFLRIVRLCYFALFVAFVFNISVVRSTLGWHLAYLTNVLIYARGAWRGAVSHFWSLAVEEQFYLVWPWLMLWLLFAQPTREHRTHVHRYELTSEVVGGFAYGSVLGSVDLPDTDRPWTTVRMRASFVACLLETYGSAPIRAIYRARSSDFAETFRTTYGQTLQDAHRAWQAFCLTRERRK